MLETKKIGDFAQEHGISMAMHMAGHVVSWYSSIHCAAATENFLVMEHHGADDANYDDPVTNITKPLLNSDGYVNVPNGPGLGIELNEEVMGITRGGFGRRGGTQQRRTFDTSTNEWNNESSHDRLWSMYIKGNKALETENRQAKNVRF